MGLQFKTSGVLLFTAGNNLAMHADCCCEEDCTECCTGSIDGFEFTLSGVVDSGCSNCAGLNTTAFCYVAEDGDGCRGTMSETVTPGCGPLVGVYTITDNGDGTCRLAVTFLYQLAGAHINAYIDFTKGNACSTVSGAMTPTSRTDGATTCDFTGATITVTGLC
jgi:hypothetical protein